MIIDRILKLNQYFEKPWVEKITSFYSNLSVNTPDGEYQVLDKNKIFCKVLSYQTRQSDWITESHKEYIDFQILLKGEELIEVYDINDLLIKNAYESEKDCVFYNYPLTENPVSKILLNKDYMAILFPQDAHATQMSSGNEIKTLKKAVFKVHKSLL